MKQHLILVAFLIAGTVWPNCSSGYGRWYAGRRVGVGYGVGYGMALGAYGSGLGYGAGYGIGGTPYSAAENARANTIRAQGEYNQQTAAAMRDYEDARKKYIDNQEQWNQVYQEKQRALAEAKAHKREADLAAKERAKAFNAAHPVAGPDRLTGSQLDPATGRLEWPIALAQSAFADQRKTVDSLFELRSHAGTNPQLAAQVAKAVNELRIALRSRVRETPTMDYIEAKRFLDSVVVEGSLPVQG